MFDEIIVGLQHGDEGKGKVTLDRLKNGSYECCVRFNGGANAGHTVYYEGKKLVLHQLPLGCIFKVKSLIGPGCVVDIDQVNKEVDALVANGFDGGDGGVKKYLYFSKNAHVISKKHIELDEKNDKIGSTKRGISYAYSDKYLRKGKRIQDIPDFAYNVVDSIDFLAGIRAPILFEGAQGFQLDIDFGDYPYVTSSNCGVSSVLTSGISFSRIKKAKVTGVAKIYETYVGAKQFQGSDELLNKLQIKGIEIGSTTGRNRQCNWLNLDTLLVAVSVNGVDEIIFNKVDILEDMKQFLLYHNNCLHKFSDWSLMQSYICYAFMNIPVVLTFSRSPFQI